MIDSLLRFSGPNRALFEELLAIDLSIEAVLHGVGNALLQFEPSLLDEWSVQGLWPKIEAYSLRFVLPLYELAVPAPMDMANVLAIQLLSCVAWRHFDDCLDSHGSIVASSLASTLSCLRLQEFAQRYSSRDVRLDLGGHYKVMALQATLERTRALELTEIWKRCSILLFSPETFARLDEDQMQVLRCYINYAGIAHDVHDFMSDASSGTKSLPVLWMAEVNPDGVFSVSAVDALYARLRERVIVLEREAREQLKIPDRFPLVHHLWMESWRTIHDR